MFGCIQHGWQHMVNQCPACTQTTATNHSGELGATSLRMMFEEAPLKVMKTHGPFTGREFAHLPPSDLHNEQCAEIANAKLAELWAALEEYDHAALEEFMRTECGNAVLTAFRALRDGEKT
jgi:hypothetical protein